MATSLHTTLTSTSSSSSSSFSEIHSSFGLAPGAATAAAQRSPWHSPVPYLFGGLAAMLGLIAFALLILACSYWKLSRDQENSSNEEDLEKGDGVNKVNGPRVYEEKIVVIMAGNDKPTFLANPVKMFLNNHTPNDVDDDDSKKPATCPSCLDADDKPKENGENDQHHN